MNPFQTSGGPLSPDVINKNASHPKPITAKEKP
jgi:hypothetical protein